MTTSARRGLLMMACVLSFFGYSVAAGAQDVSFTPAALAWGSVAVGQTSGVKSVMVTNTQSVALTISSIAASANFFETTSDCPLAPATLPVSATCTISAAFRPLAAGALSGTLTLTDDAPSSPQSIPLSGTGTLGPLQFSPTSLPFPDTTAGTVSAAQTATLTNTTSAAITLNSITHFGQFTESDNCPVSPSPLAANTSCNITVTFNPIGTGALTGGVNVNYGASSSTSVFLTGNGLAPPLTVVPRVGLNFSAQTTGGKSFPQTITLTNTLSAPLTISSFISTPRDFLISTDCVSKSGSGTLAAQGSCTITVIFQPLSKGAINGSITITYNAAGSPTVIPLSGFGVASSNGVNVTVNPLTPCVLPSQTQQFTATVIHTPNTAVTWFVDNVANGNATSGTISDTGLYVAPPATGAHVIKAFSQANPTAAGAAFITITNTPAFAIYPFTASVLASSTQLFQGQICGGIPDSNVTFTVDSIPGGNAKVGTIDSSGIYTAPSTPGTHAIRVTDASLNKSSGGLATVYTNVTVDFGSRKNTAHPIPADLFGVNHADTLRTPADLGLVAAAISTTRTYAVIPLVYATPTPNWTKIDVHIAALLSAGLRPIMEMAFTPPFLQPSPNPCGAGNETVPPTDFNQWGQIAASYVQHFDAKFRDPNDPTQPFVQDYEIWNEPNTSALCHHRPSDYIGIYAAAAPLMKQQAAADGVNIRIGGPAVAGLDSSFITPLLTNPLTAPYVDFVSYHSYLFGGANIESAWDVFNGSKPVYQREQEPGDGVGAVYSRASALVASGSQPLGANTPIYIDEYNLNYRFLHNCCSNDPTFAPVFNGLFVTDVLNTIYSGSAQIPAKLSYFSANAYPYFCLIGTLNSNMDCQYSIGSTPVPYPQYFLYQLLSTPTYLGLQKGGGFMAASVSPPTSAGGLAVTGFYTATQDSILIVNPTATNYPQVVVNAQNGGFSTPTAELFQIVNGNAISRSLLPLTLSPDGLSYTAAIPVPAYTVLAIGVQGNPIQVPGDVTGTLTAAPEPSAFGSPFVITATVVPATGTGAPTGTVIFSVDGAAIGNATLTNGSASIPGSATLTAGGHILSASYSGDANFNPATFSGNHVVVGATTALALQANPNPATFEQAVTFTAKVSAGATPAIGQVSFSDGPTPLGTADLDATGVATLAVNTLSVGSHNVSANYAGNLQFATSSGSVVEVIDSTPSATVLTSSVNPSQFGQSVTFTAKISAGSSPANGQVSFSDGATQLGTVTLDAAGAAILTTSALFPGSHTITASYSGNAQFLASSAAVTQVVNGMLPTTATLASSLNPSQFGQPVTFSATVATISGVPTGMVTFLDGGTSLGGSSLNAQGTAALSTSALTVGTHSVTAMYQGTTLLAQSTSASLTQVVQPLPPADFTMQLIPPSLSVLTGETATYSVVVSPINAFNGVVTFTCSVGGARESTCSFSPATLTGSGATILSVHTGLAHPTSSRTNTPRSTLVMAGLFCSLLFFRKKWRPAAFLLVLLFVGVSGCGSGGDLGTPKGTYTISATGTCSTPSGPIAHTVTGRLKVN